LPRSTTLAAGFGIARLAVCWRSVRREDLPQGVFDELKPPSTLRGMPERNQRTAYFYLAPVQRTSDQKLGLLCVVCGLHRHIGHHEAMPGGQVPHVGRVVVGQKHVADTASSGRE